jgi:putative transposase
MIVRELKLKLLKSQEDMLNEWLWILTGAYNWAIRKIELDNKDKIYQGQFGLHYLIKGHNNKINIPCHTLQDTLTMAYKSWKRYYECTSKRPKLKGRRNKMRSIGFPDAISRSRLFNNKILITKRLGYIKYHKQALPEGKIKQARIIKRASGWYCQLTIDTKHTFKVKKTDKSVGIDTGFKKLLTLSDGVTFENQRYFIKLQERLGQAQRAGNNKLVGRINERIANARKDWNHKVSRKIVEDYKNIYITNDNLIGIKNRFGKSINDAGIGQLRKFIAYKSDNHNRHVAFVDSKFTTMTCGHCGARTGPTGLSKLKVRTWECGECGSLLDRDINAANVILKFGLGFSLAPTENKFRWVKPKSHKESIIGSCGLGVGRIDSFD